jgi:hypothetical protein
LRNLTTVRLHRRFEEAAAFCFFCVRFVQKQEEKPAKYPAEFGRSFDKTGNHFSMAVEM